MSLGLYEIADELMEHGLDGVADQVIQIARSREDAQEALKSQDTPQMMDEPRNMMAPTESIIPIVEVVIYNDGTVMVRRVS